MPTTDLTPGTITTLGQLRPGDVGEIPDGRERRFLIIEKNHYSLMRFADSCYIGSDDEPVRYLGRGRIEDGRIVMDGEPGDRVAELEEQVRTLRDGCEQIAEHIANGDEDIAQYLAYDLIAATAPKEKPCTPAAPDRKEVMPCDP